MGYWLQKSECTLEGFRDVMAQARAADSGPDWTAEVAFGIPIYECGDLRARLVSDTGRRALMDEFARMLQHGSGIVVLKNCFADADVVDEVTGVFNQIMSDERALGGGQGDHFGTNARIWNAAEKLCLAAPDLFVRYFGNEIVAIVAEAWLGPNYQVTAQTNLVHPGGKGQVGHRDYHLGFMSPDDAIRYPTSAHLLSPFLTLQGAVAHCDMPVDSGPTKYLPYSQHYEAGYVAAAMPEFATFFEDEYVQLPLEKGDAVYFNPAVMHGAGDNVTDDVERLANLMQISSAFGRAIEVVDRAAMCQAIYPSVLSHAARGDMTDAQIYAAIAACAEGYPFPTSLDRDPPVGGLAPRSQADIMREAVGRSLKYDAFVRELEAHKARQAPGTHI